MDYERRQRVEVFWRNVFVLAVLAFLLGLVISAAGLVIGIVAGTFIALWIGLALAGAGVVGWFLATTSAMGIAKMDVDAALQRMAVDASRTGTAEPLAELLEAGQEIQFDDEEAGWIERESKGVVQGLEGRVFPAEDAHRVESGLACTALTALARSRLDRGELRLAASTAMKATALAPYMPWAWLYWAEAYAKYGDGPKAELLLKTANEVARQAGLPGEEWERLARPMRELIEHASSERRE